MKNGIFKPLCLYAFLLFTANGCASLLDTSPVDNTPADRGYSADNDNNYDAEATERAYTASQDKGESVDSDASSRVKRAIATRDVVLGMTRQEVKNSWGEPAERELAGNGSSGHERWIYGSRYSLNGSRVLIFENGRVAGWYR